jgi:hypothetical protein
MVGLTDHVRCWRGRGRGQSAPRFPLVTRSGHPVGSETVAMASSGIVLDFRFVTHRQTGTGQFRPLAAWFKKRSGLFL